MTDKFSIEKEVNKILETTIEDFAIQEDKGNCDLCLIGMDSLKFITVIVELEKTFKIEYPDEYLEIGIMNTANKIVNSVYSLLKKTISEK